jgi:hypothetical protein
MTTLESCIVCTEEKNSNIMHFCDPSCHFLHGDCDKYLGIKGAYVCDDCAAPKVCSHEIL